MQAYHGFPVVNVNTQPIGVSVMNIDAAKARDIMALYHWGKQRPCRRPTVARYAEMMKSGEWRPGSELEFVSVQEDGRIYCVNGQHRLAAVEASDTEQVFTVKVIAVADDAEAAHQYTHTDIGLNRTPNDRLGAYGVSEIFGWTSSDVNKARSAVVYVYDSFGSGNTRIYLTPDMELALIRKYAEQIDVYFEMVDEMGDYAVKSSARRRATMAVAIVTLSQSVIHFGDEKVRSFWEGALSGDELARNDARMFAYKHLLTSSMRGGGSTATNNISSHYSARYLARCFNAWVQDREPKLIRVGNDKAPISIDGSFFDGKTLYKNFADASIATTTPANKTPERLNIRP